MGEVHQRLTIPLIVLATDDPTSTDVVRWDRKLVLAWLRSLEIEEDSIKVQTRTPHAHGRVVG
jgi:hypothetical protein